MKGSSGNRGGVFWVVHTGSDHKKPMHTYTRCVCINSILYNNIIITNNNIIKGENFGA